MNGFRHLLLTFAISVGIAFLLSALPNLPSHGNIREATAPEGNIRLTNENLVDQFVRLPFHLGLRRVEWNGELLRVDFDTGRTALSREDVYEDLFLLCEFGFSGTSNVQKLLVRVMAPGGPHTADWLLSLSASRSGWSRDAVSKVRSDEGNAKAFLERHFQIHYSQRWSAGGRD